MHPARPADPAGPLVDEAADVRREAIVSGRLRPGTRLVQERLAEELGISRTPLREALRWLEQQGLVTALGGRGWAVTELSAEALLDDYDVREVLDGLAARLAAMRLAPGELARIQAVCRRGWEHVERWNPGGWLLDNTEFHVRILRAAHSPALERAMPVGRMSAQLLLPGTFLHQERARLALQEHEVILAALRARDPEAAEAAARAHVGRVRAALAEQLEQSTRSGTGLRRLRVLRRPAGARGATP